MDWEFAINRYKVLSIEWINDRVLLESIENYIQSPEINHGRKAYKKECMCITVSLCCTAEINIVNQLYFSTKIRKKKKRRAPGT